MNRHNKLAIATFSVALALAACSAKGAESDQAQDDGVKAGPGITTETITVGSLNDLSGPFAVSGKEVEAGHNIYWEARNANGGVCGRTVEFLSKDTGYDPQRTKSQYVEIRDNVAALAAVLGAPTTMAISSDIESDKMTTVALSNASNLLENPYIVEAGTTYELEMVNLVSYLSEQGKITSGDQLGVIYLQGEFGEAGLAGAKYAADKLGMSVVEKVAQGTDRDATAQVTALKAAGVKAILVTASPAILNSVVTVAKANGLNVPVASNNPGFAPTSLDTAAKDALEGDVYFATSFAPLNSPVSADVFAAYKESFPDGVPGMNLNYGYSTAALLDDVLSKACEDKDLSREGIAAAAQSLANVDADGIMVPVDLTKDGVKQSTQIFVVKADSTVDGRVKAVAEQYSGEIAADYGN